ncbi:MAG TPA: histidine kinase dimerization/phospho-acceptor domain-containing protein, partial [Thermoanaerobaculia bacterium]|nr:histidine kinase dimerization/phospho-acceptor domain-containing protein [Thermoanaerobaculia bacterium]
MEERFEHLLAINRAIAETLDYEEVLRLVVDKTTQLTGARACALLLADDSGRARVAAWRGIDDDKAKAFSASLDERINAALRELLDHRSGDDFVGVPVIHHGRVTGILVVHREGAKPAHGHEGEDEEAILAALADQAAIALDHASRYRELWVAGQLAQRELETAARRKDDFLAMLSHELRNPLAAIASAIEVLRFATAADPRFAHAHAIAERQTEHMKRLLDDLLDVSRVTQDRIVLRRRPVAMQEVVQQAIDGSAP